MTLGNGFCKSGGCFQRPLARRAPRCGWSWTGVRVFVRRSEEAIWKATSDGRRALRRELSDEIGLGMVCDGAGMRGG